MSMQTPFVTQEDSKTPLATQVEDTWLLEHPADKLQPLKLRKGSIKTEVQVTERKASCK